MVKRALLFILAAIAAAGITAARAEYPPPGSTLSAFVLVNGLPTATASVATGSSVPIVCSIRAPDGSPVPGVPCTFTISSEPGTDASIGSKSTVKITGPDGTATATLFVGSTPGTIEVLIEAGGATRIVTIKVAGPVPATLPRTGGEPPQDTGGNLPTPLIAALVATAAAGLGAGAIVVRRRARRA